jgi:hypothetical protein
MVATPVAAAGGIGWDGDSKAPNPTFNADVTVDEWSGADFDEALQYYDDSGDAAQLPASVNASNDNPITLTATDIAFEQNDEFPRKSEEDGENTASALDADEWTTSGATVSSTTTAPGVDALNYAGSASSDSATYSNFTVEDGEKGYLTIAADINSASGTPTLQLTDGDGDYVEVTLYDATGDASNDTLLANSTGEGMVLQEQVGDLTVQGGGDGTFDSTDGDHRLRRHRRGRVGSRQRAHARTGVRRAARRERRRRARNRDDHRAARRVLGREHGRAR